MNMFSFLGRKLCVRCVAVWGGRFGGDLREISEGFMSHVCCVDVVAMILFVFDLMDRASCCQGWCFANTFLKYPKGHRVSISSSFGFSSSISSNFRAFPSINDQSRLPVSLQN